MKYIVTRLEDGRVGPMGFVLIPNASAMRGRILTRLQALRRCRESIGQGIGNLLRTMEYEEGKDVTFLEWNEQTLAIFLESNSGCTKLEERNFEKLDREGNFEIELPFNFTGRGNIEIHYRLMTIEDRQVSFKAYSRQGTMFQSWPLAYDVFLVE